MTMTPQLRIPDWWMSDDLLVRARACLIAQMDAFVSRRIAYEQRSPTVADEIEEDERALERLLGLIITEQRERREVRDRHAHEAADNVQELMDAGFYHDGTPPGGPPPE
jgi:hypothetical protein